MAISDKLNYLIETKQLFKDRLNSLGAEITSSTTFRNYLTWLDTFYGEVSDKTDLSVNGVVGRTSQESTTGANVMPVANVTKTTGGIEITNNGDGTLTLNGTATAQIVYPITNTGNNTLRRVPVTENDYKFMLYGDTNVSNDTYFLQVLFGLDSETTKFFAATGNGATSLHIETDRSIGYALIIRKGQSFNNHIIKPMGVLSTYTGGFEPFTNGASPNPDYPQPINNLSGDVAYKVSGKNLFDLKQRPSASNGLTSTINSDGTIHVSGTATTTWADITAQTPVFIENNTQVTFSIEESLPVKVVCNILSNQGPGQGVVIESNYTSTTITTNNEKNTAYIYVSGLIANTQYDFIIKKPMLEKSSIATTYEPYIEPQTFNIPLGDIELCEVGTGTYKKNDKIYSSNGRFYLEKNIGKVVLDGSESSWNVVNAYDRDYFYVNISGILVSNNNANPPLLYSNYYKSYTATDLIVSGVSNYGICRRTNYSQVLFRNIDTTSLANFKTWLSTHNTIVYYALSTPTTTEITQENYPALYNALKQIQDYLTAYKINKEFILGYSSPEIEY